MKPILFFLALIFSVQLVAQNEEEAIRKTIDTFFQGFHEQDSAKIKSVVADSMIMQTIGMDKEGKTRLRDVDFSLFLRNIVSIPDSIPFREVIKAYTIKIDGPMANAWLDYEFWLRNAMSHCGVNNFQLMSQDGQWRIIYLIDTRRKEACQ